MTSDGLPAVSGPVHCILERLAHGELDCPCSRDLDLGTGRNAHLSFVMDFLTRNNVSTIQELFGLRPDLDRDQVYLAIARNLVATDLDRAFIRDEQAFLLLRDAACRDLYLRSRNAKRPRTSALGWCAELFEPGTSF